MQYQREESAAISLNRIRWRTGSEEMIHTRHVDELSIRERGPEEVAFVLAMLGNVLLYVGFMAGKSTRVYPNSDSTGGFSTGTEGMRAWAVVVALCAITVSIGLVLLKVNAQKAMLVYFLLIIPFGVALVAAGLHWVDLLREQSRDIEYELQIAIGMPLVIVGGVIGMIPAIWSTFRFLRSRVSS